jgi:hypothetical protein
MGSNKLRARPQLTPEIQAFQPLLYPPRGQKWQCHTQSELPLGLPSSAPVGRWNPTREAPHPQRHKWQCHTQSELPLGLPSSAPVGRWNPTREAPHPQRHKWQCHTRSEPPLESVRPLPLVAGIQPGKPHILNATSGSATHKASCRSVSFARSRWSLESNQGSPTSSTPQVAVPHTKRAAARSRSPAPVGRWNPTREAPHPQRHKCERQAWSGRAGFVDCFHFRLESLVPDALRATDSGVLIATCGAFKMRIHRNSHLGGDSVVQRRRLKCGKVRQLCSNLRYVSFGKPRGIGEFF